MPNTGKWREKCQTQASGEKNAKHRQVERCPTLASGEGAQHWQVERCPTLASGEKEIRGMQAMRL